MSPCHVAPPVLPPLLFAEEEAMIPSSLLPLQILTLLPVLFLIPTTVTGGSTD